MMLPNLVDPSSLMVKVLLSFKCLDLALKWAVQVSLKEFHGKFFNFLLWVIVTRILLGSSSQLLFRERGRKWAKTMDEFTNTDFELNLTFHK